MKRLKLTKDQMVEYLLKKERDLWIMLKLAEKEHGEESFDCIKAYAEWTTVYNILADFGFSGYELELNSRDIREE